MPHPQQPATPAVEVGTPIRSMAANQPVHLSVYFVDFLGTQHLGADWAKLREALASKLADLAAAARPNDLWGDTYGFPDLAAALQAATTAVDTVKGAFRWERTGEPLPVQLLLHDNEAEATLGLDPRMWAFMLPEELYATKRAWELWKNAGTTAALPPHSTRDELLAALRVSLSGRPAAPPVHVFPARTAPLSGGGEECFYCGLRSHRPPQCPSRHLRPDASGLSLVGRMPLAKLRGLYAKVFPATGKPAAELTTETGPDQLRKSPELQVLTAFYDLNRVFQPRFLATLFLARADSWPEKTVARGGCSLASSPICRGVQALVVHNYPDAEAIFGDITGTDPETKFFSEVGLALLAVEKGQPQRVRYHLERAGKSTNTEAEKVYVQLLKSRLQAVTGDLPGALRTLDEALEQRRSCDDLRYQRDRVAVLAGRTDGCAQRLQLLASRRAEAAVALLLDPWLEPIRAELDHKLLNLFLSAHQGGKGKYSAARAQGTALAAWLGEQDPDVVPVLSGLQRLGGKVAQAGYYDMLDLDRDSDALSRSCEQTRRSRNGALQGQIDAVEKLWDPLREFWREFTLKNRYRELGERFAQAEENLARARHLAQQDDVTRYQEAMDRLGAVRTAIGELAAQTREIGAVPLIYAFVRRFIAYLVMMESLALAVGLAILPLFRLVLSLDRGRRASAAGGNSVLYTLTFAVAPVLALVLTGMKQKKAAKAGAKA